MAPVAGGIAHRQQQRNVPLSRLGERGGTPLVPGDRVVLVLEQGGRGGVGEPIGHAAEPKGKPAFGQRRKAKGRPAAGGERRNRDVYSVVRTGLGSCGSREAGGGR